MTDEIKREHTYHAEAFTLSAKLELPIDQEICPQSYLKIPGTGGYLSHQTENYRLGHVISYRSAYTQVAGNPDRKEGHGWSTLATSVIENLNVLDVVTADRVVAQVSTDHPLVGYIPSVTFIGTRFENLRIAGHPVKLDLDPGILGLKPGNDAPYTGDPGFIQRVATQHERLRGHLDVPAEILDRCKRGPVMKNDESGKQESIECSLVNQADGGYPGRSFGHVIDVPNFGKIYLATVRLIQSDYETKTGAPAKTLISLTMIELEMGCIGKGKAAIGGAEVNGNSKP
jgi:hypothetical protein